MNHKNCQAFFDEIYNNRRNCEDEERDYKLVFHFKDPRDKLNLVKDIVSFANTQGGYIVYGVTDKDYEWVGLDDTSDDIDDNKIRDFMRDYVTQIPSFSCGTYKKDGNIFFLITIDKSLPDLIFMKRDGEYYVKKKGSNKEAPQYVFRNRDLYGRIGSSCKPVGDDPSFQKLRRSSCVHSARKSGHRCGNQWPLGASFRPGF